MSLGRYLDGRDTNVNGRDFGFAPLTPGASNNLAQNASHTIPDVNSVAVGTELSANYAASFILPRVIDPTQIGPVGFPPNNINPKAIMASPQTGRAIIAYDETGGGNSVYSKDLVNKFELWAYIETADLNLNQATVQSEASTYGIGTTDPFFGTPNQAGLNTLTSTQNGNTGIGWMIQRAIEQRSREPRVQQQRSQQPAVQRQRAAPQRQARPPQVVRQRATQRQARPPQVRQQRQARPAREVRQRAAPQVRQERSRPSGGNSERRRRN